MPPSTAFRLARASVFAAVCVLLASLGHLAASGRPMDPGTVALGFAGVLGLAVAVSGHERSLPTIMGGLLIGQFTLHALFSSGSTAHHAAPGAPSVHGEVPGPGMALAHVLAALATAWWLRRGERRAWQLVRALVRPLPPPLAVPSPPPSRLVVVPRGEPRVRCLAAVLRHVLVLRGPPAVQG
ncbi:MFS transporter [Spirillospora sp. CA-294931]|uniref:MFS transporter n=1 Tax=Spirillospora sp. CA-294931 TaxID=3240042 RepID=UPI003D8D86A8